MTGRFRHRGTASVWLSEFCKKTNGLKATNPQIVQPHSENVDVPQCLIGCGWSCGCALALFLPLDYVAGCRSLSSANSISRQKMGVYVGPSIGWWAKNQPRFRSGRDTLNP